MIYEYKCISIDCKDRNKEVHVIKSIQDSDRIEHCEKCGNVLQRIFGIGGIKTGDGYKT